MRLLLDTHAFLWACLEPHKLPPRVHAVLSEQGGSLLSVASLWEICIKVKSGKLPISRPSYWLRTAIADLQLSVLPIRVKHALLTLELPPHHRDPFDRILIAQAIEQQLPIASADEAFGKYGAKVFWE